MNKINLFGIRRDFPELVEAQVTGMATQVPFLYLILLANTAALAYTHYGTAPDWLTIYTFGLFSLVCAYRAYYWVQQRAKKFDMQRGQQNLMVVFKGAVSLSMILSLWAVLLYPYGDASQKSHVVYFMSVTVIGCVFCLMQYPPAAFVVMIIVGSTAVMFFGSSGNTVFMTIAANLALMSFMIFKIINTYFSAFSGQVAARRELLSLNDRVLLASRVKSEFLASSYGPDHPNVARELNNLAELFEDQGNWATALTFRASAKPILIDANAVPERQMSASGKAVPTQNSGSLKAHARALYHADAADARNLAEGFELAQWALQNPAADALSTMSARFAAGDANLANLVRKSQDVSNARGGAYRVLDLAVSKADRGAAEAARKNIAGMEAALAEMQEIMARDFPNYAALANPRPLSLAGAQALLGENQALVLFADLRQSGTVSEETLVFALTRSDARWASVPLGTNALQERVARLRCGLDEEEWVAASRARRCGDRLGLNAVPEASKPLPFNIEDAYGLYCALFGDIEELVAGKQQSGQWRRQWSADGLRRRRAQAERGLGRIVGLQYCRGR